MASPRLRQRRWVGSGRKGGWKKERASDWLYGNWRFITPRQGAQSCLPCWPLVETRGQSRGLRLETPAGRECSLGALGRRKRRLMKIKRRKKKRAGSERCCFFTSMFTSGHDSPFLLQHRNYFVITRSLCGAKSPRGWVPGVELCVKRELYIRGDRIQRISLNNNKSSRRRKIHSFRWHSLSFSTGVRVEPSRHILRLLYKL